jgi:DNA-nicking Smr family endonuclease
MNNRILDLHSLYFEGESFVQLELEEVLDNFLAPHIMEESGELVIITGKGIHSKHFIEGKNPLKYYTEIYLDKLGLDWNYEDERHGGVGAIQVIL